MLILGSGLRSSGCSGNEEKDMGWHGCTEELAPAFSPPANTLGRDVKGFGISHFPDDFTRVWKLGSGLCSAVVLYSMRERREEMAHGYTEKSAPACTPPARTSGRY